MTNLLLILLLVVGCNKTKLGCVDSQACNYNADANLDNNSCWYASEGCSCDDAFDSTSDECGLCDTDETNNCVQDECGIWGGDGVDVDGDGICDDVDECITFDECGNCQGQETEWVELWGECYNIETTTEINCGWYHDCPEVSGGIPPEIGELINLMHLDLSENELTGQIPSTIGNLSSLDTLYLHNNHLTYIPESIGNLSSLVSLSFSDNQITSLPGSIGNLSSLERLYLHNNNLTSIPESIENLSSLLDLYLYDNQLTSLPESSNARTSMLRSEPLFSRLVIYGL